MATCGGGKAIGTGVGATDPLNYPNSSFLCARFARRYNIGVTDPDVSIVGSTSEDTLVTIVVKKDKDTAFSVKFKYNPDLKEPDWGVLRDFIVGLGRAKQLAADDGESVASSQ